MGHKRVRRVIEKLRNVKARKFGSFAEKRGNQVMKDDNLVPRAFSIQDREKALRTRLEG